MSNDRHFEDQLNSYLGVVCRQERSFDRKKSQLVRQIANVSQRHADGDVRQLQSKLRTSELQHKQSLDVIADLIDVLHPHAHPADKKHPRPRA